MDNIEQKVDGIIRGFGHDMSDIVRQANAYASQAQKEAIETYMRNRPRGEAIPSRVPIVEPLQSVIENAYWDYRKSVDDGERDALAKLGYERTEPLSAEDDNTISFFEQQETLNESDVRGLVERYKGNYIALRRIAPLANRAGFNLDDSSFDAEKKIKQIAGIARKAVDTARIYAYDNVPEANEVSYEYAMTCISNVVDHGIVGFMAWMNPVEKVAPGGNPNLL